MSTPLRLRGMEDRGPESAHKMAWAGEALCSFLSRYGYERVDTPVLEETELLLRKSGGELASKMYTFTDPGGHRVSLRPEFTSSIVRAYLQDMNGGRILPARWSYMGPVFRYEQEEIGRRQFTQVGGELIGAAGPWADAEVMAIAVKGLSVLGLKGHRLVVGHLGFISALLDSMELSDRARLFFLSSVGSLGHGSQGLFEVRQKGRDLGLLPGEDEEEERVESGVSMDVALALLEQYAQRPGLSNLGVRTPQEIKERFLRKQHLARQNGQFHQALEMLDMVVQVRGEPQEALKEVRRVVKGFPVQGALDELEDSLKALAHYQISVPVIVDFGLARGIAYYTGVVFDVQHAQGAPVSLGGGGRYDGLVEALGRMNPKPALGFAWSLESVVDAMEVEGKLGEPTGPPQEAVLVRPGNASGTAAAAREAERLRAQGNRVYLEMDYDSLKESILRARGRGVGRIVTVAPDGKTRSRKVASI